MQPIRKALLLNLTMSSKSLHPRTDLDYGALEEADDSVDAFCDVLRRNFCGGEFQPRDIELVQYTASTIMKPLLEIVRQWFLETVTLSVRKHLHGRSEEEQQNQQYQLVMYVRADLVVLPRDRHDDEKNENGSEDRHEAFIRVPDDIAFTLIPFSSFAQEVANCVPKGLCLHLFFDGRDTEHSLPRMLFSGREPPRFPLPLGEKNSGTVVGLASMNPDLVVSLPPPPHHHPPHQRRRIAQLPPQQSYDNTSTRRRRGVLCAFLAGQKNIRVTGIDALTFRKVLRAFPLFLFAQDEGEKDRGNEQQHDDAVLFVPPTFLSSEKSSRKAGIRHYQPGFASNAAIEAAARSADAPVFYSGFQQRIGHLPSRVLS